jgi:hypothetical protein
MLCAVVMAIVAGAPAAAQTASGAHAAPPAAAPTNAGPVPIPRTTFIETMDSQFRLMDADKNGILTRKEIEDFQRATAMLVAQERNVALFKALDKDKNGQLSPAEFAALPMNVPAANAAPVLAQTDGNHDGQVTLIEYRAGKLRNFDAVDADKDGVASLAEQKAAGIIK